VFNPQLCKIDPAQPYPDLRYISNTGGKLPVPMVKKNQAAFSGNQISVLPVPDWICLNPKSQSSNHIVCFLSFGAWNLFNPRTLLDLNTQLTFLIYLWDTTQYSSSGLIAAAEKNIF